VGRQSVTLGRSGLCSVVSSAWGMVSMLVMCLISFVMFIFASSVSCWVGGVVVVSVISVSLLNQSIIIGIASAPYRLCQYAIFEIPILSVCLRKNNTPPYTLLGIALKIDEYGDPITLVTEKANPNSVWFQFGDIRVRFSSKCSVLSAYD